MNRSRRILATTALLLLAALPASAHLSWVRLPDGLPPLGEPARVSLDHGDVFPVSAGSLPLDHVTAHVVAPDGVRAGLALREEGNSLVADFTPRETGLHVLHYVYDPGVMSKTLDGWHIGGADLYPRALDRLRGIQTAVAYVFADDDPEAAHAPLGLPLELVPRIVGDAIELTLLKDSRPYAGAAILHLPRDAEAREIGTTDDAGVVTFTPPDGRVGEIAFGVKIKLPMPEGSEFDRDVFFTTLCLDFRGAAAP